MHVNMQNISLIKINKYKEVKFNKYIFLKKLKEKNNMVYGEYFMKLKCSLFKIYFSDLSL